VWGYVLLDGHVMGLFGHVLLVFLNNDLVLIFVRRICLFSSVLCIVLDIS
jgi:hypothetical protein